MRSRVVLVTGELPHDNPGHAGGVYVQHVHALASANADVTVIAPDSPANRSALGQPGSPEVTLLSTYPATGSPWRKATEGVLFRLDHEVRRRMIGLPSYLIARALLADSPERRAVLRADVVDLQWSEAIRLAPLIRRLNPGARLVGTFHDVQSQVLARLVETDPSSVGLRGLNAGQLRRAERRALDRLDDVVVFSEKDAALLGGHSSIRVIRPPLASGTTERPHPVTADPVAIMVSVLSRPENSEAATWLLTEVWPSVVAEEPSARLRLIGGGAGADLTRLAESTPGVTLTGYVDSLEAEYDGASVAVVPMLRGAGVKFKTIEALVRGVPVVTTPVGAEGIGSSDLYAECSSDADRLAGALLRTLRLPEDARRRADKAQQWAIDAYGYDQFFREMSSSYGISGWTAPPRT